MKVKDPIEEEYKQLMFDIKYDKEQFKDPETLGLLMYRLSKEREKTNYLFDEILKKLQHIAKNTEKITVKESKEKELLSDTDQQIIEYARKQGKVDAEEIQSFLGYKGRNAASARLNALYERGLLMKARAGKKVKYWVQG